MRRGGKATANCYRSRGKAVDWISFWLAVCVCVREANLQLKTLFILSQGQWGRFRNRLNRTGQHSLAHFRDPQTSRAIDWYFALGGTNGPGPVGSYRHCLVRPHCCCSTFTRLDCKTFFPAWNSNQFFCSVSSQKPYFLYNTLLRNLFIFFKGWSCSLSWNCTEPSNVTEACFLVIAIMGATCWHCTVSMLVQNTLNIDGWWFDTSETWTLWETWTNSYTP